MWCCNSAPQGTCVREPARALTGVLVEAVVGECERDGAARQATPPAARVREACPRLHVKVRQASPAFRPLLPRPLVPHPLESCLVPTPLKISPPPKTACPNTHARTRARMRRRPEWGRLGATGGWPASTRGR